MDLVFGSFELHMNPVTVLVVVLLICVKSMYNSYMEFSWLYEDEEVLS